jgi:hypothetical protein
MQLYQFLDIQSLTISALHINIMGNKMYAISYFYPEIYVK